MAHKAAGFGLEMNMQLQQAFAGVVAAVEQACREQFTIRLAGQYIAGSVAAGEAWPGASDLDCFAFLVDEPTKDDVEWQKRTQQEMDRRFPVVSEVHLNLHSSERLKAEAFWRFIIRYNGVRIAGADLVGQMEQQGVPTPAPGAQIAKSRLGFVRKCLDEALAGRCPPALAQLPADPCLASRKLARNFVVVEGAFVLMALGQFQSFRQLAVLEGLRRAEPHWHSMLNMTAAILADPFQAGVNPEQYMQHVAPFVDWGMEIIKNA